MTAPLRNARRSLLTRLLKLAAIPAAAAMLSSCAGLTGPRQVEVPLEKLQANIGKRFPLHHRALGVFDIQLSNPQLTTLRENDRIVLGADVTVSPILVRQSWRGSLALSGRLVVDNVRNAVFLSDAQVERFAVDGMGEAQQRQVAGAANILADKVIRDVPVYSYKPEDLRFAGIQFMPVAIRTTASSLVLVVEPAR